MSIVDRINARLPLPTILAERWLVIALVLAVIAGLTQWIAWLNADDEPFDSFVGPPRSDYTLSNFTLQSFDENGAFAFAVDAPRLNKHPYVGSFDIDDPAFRIRDAKGQDWRAKSKRGWISGNAKELRLTGSVELDRPAGAQTGPLEVRSEELVAHVDTNEVTSSAAVSIRQPGSILRGTGLAANLDTRRFQLKSRVSARFDPRAAQRTSPST